MSGERAPRRARERRPWLRAGLAGLVMAMLPFTWSEDSTCDHKPMPQLTGLQILGRHPEIAGYFFVVLIAVVGIGFLAYATKNLWLRFVCSVLAGVGGGSISMLCTAMLTFGRSEQPLDHPAAWIGTLAAGVMMLEAWEASGRTLAHAFTKRRAARRQRQAEIETNPRFATPPVPRARFADVRSEPEAEAEAEAEEEASARPARRARRAQ